jgi:hypothetical protein
MNADMPWHTTGASVARTAAAAAPVDASAAGAAGDGRSGQGASGVGLLSSALPDGLPAFKSLAWAAPLLGGLMLLVHFWRVGYLPALSFAELGVVLGALAYALYNRSFHWEGFRGTQDTALHIVGAALMGIGGVTAGGCTVGQGLSGLSTLSVTSLIAVVGIMLGAIGGLRLQMWLLMRE